MASNASENLTPMPTLALKMQRTSNCKHIDLAILHAQYRSMSVKLELRTEKTERAPDKDRWFQDKIHRMNNYQILLMNLLHEFYNMNLLANKRRSFLEIRSVTKFINIFL